MPGETQVVAIFAKNTGGPAGIKGIFAAGRLVTDGTWKCNNVAAPNWKLPTFDDSTWPAAREIRYAGNKKHFNGIPVKGHGSKWIWAAGSRTLAFCRGVISKFLLNLVAPKVAKWGIY